MVGSRSGRGHGGTGSVGFSLLSRIEYPFGPLTFWRFGFLDSGACTRDGHDVGDSHSTDWRIVGTDHLASAFLSNPLLAILRLLPLTFFKAWQCRP